MRPCLKGGNTSKPRKYALGLCPLEMTGMLAPIKQDLSKDNTNRHANSEEGNLMGSYPKQRVAAINNLRQEGLTVLKNQLLVCHPVQSGHP